MRIVTMFQHIEQHVALYVLLVGIMILASLAGEETTIISDTENTYPNNRPCHIFNSPYAPAEITAFLHESCGG